MASQSKGIQQLLQAEKRAADLVSEARKRKTKRLKEAKEEARAEIDGFRGERERQFRVYQREHMGSKDDFEAKIEEQTRARLDKVSQDVVNNKEAVIERILNLVYDIKPEVHENLRL